MCKKGVQLNERLLKHFFISSYHIVLQLNTTPNTIFSLYSSPFIYLYSNYFITFDVFKYFNH